MMKTRIVYSKSGNRISNCLRKHLTGIAASVLLIGSTGCANGITNSAANVFNNTNKGTINSNYFFKTKNKKEYKVGDTFENDGVKMVYVASGDYVEDNEFMQPKEGYKFIFLRFAIINEGKSDATVTYFDFNCYADGYQCDSNYTASNLSATVSPGRSATGDISFEVPVDAQEIEVEYTPDMFSSDKVKFIFEGTKDSGYVAETSAKETKGAHKVGDVIEQKNVKISYLSTDTYVSDNMFIQPEEGYHYAYIELEFENTSDKDQTVSSMVGFNCYADGKSCKQAFVRDDDLSGDISSGRKLKGTVTFEVPDNAQLVEVEYNDNFWTSDKIVFKVQ